MVFRLHSEMAFRPVPTFKRRFGTRANQKNIRSRCCICKDATKKTRPGPKHSKLYIHQRENLMYLQDVSQKATWQNDAKCERTRHSTPLKSTQISVSFKRPLRYPFHPFPI